MSALMLDVLGWSFIVIGGLALVVAGVGVLRMPEFFTRLHAAGIADTGGVLFIVLGLMTQCESWLTAVKLGLILVFMMFTSPTATHAIAKAALHGGLSATPAADDPEREA